MVAVDGDISSQRSARMCQLLLSMLVQSFLEQINRPQALAKVPTHSGRPPKVSCHFSPKEFTEMKIPLAHLRGGGAHAVGNGTTEQGVLGAVRQDVALVEGGEAMLSHDLVAKTETDTDRYRDGDRDALHIPT